MLMALVMAFFLLCWGVGSVFPPKRSVGWSLRFCGFVCLNVDKNDFNVINKSMVGFWDGFGLVLELYRVVWMVGY